MKKVIISIVAALALLVVSVPGAVFALEEGNTSGTFTVQNVAPTVDSVALWTTVETPEAATSMSPQVEYNVKVGVTDANTLDNLSTITVTIFYDADGTYAFEDVAAAGSGNVQTAAILTWTNLVTDTWTIDAVSGAGTWSIVSANCVVPTITETTGTFEFHFIPGKVATETVGTPKWHIYALADDGTETVGAYQADRTMNWYGEITINSGTAAFGDVALGCVDEDSTAISTTYISNGNYSEQVKSSTPWTTSGGSVALNTTYTPGSGEFSLKADDDADTADYVQVLSASYVDIATDESLTTESGDTTANNTLWLSLGSSGIPVGIYTGTVYFQIANR